MNNKKKIIRTLRKADKASVEKLLAEEKKKNEIFEKAQRKANIIEEDYTDAVKGVEKYERRINMTRIAISLYKEANPFFFFFFTGNCICTNHIN